MVTLNPVKSTVLSNYHRSVVWQCVLVLEAFLSLCKGEPMRRKIAHACQLGIGSPGTVLYLVLFAQSLACSLAHSVGAC